MDTDLVLTSGIALLALSLPSLLAGWVDGRLSRLGTLLVATSTGLILWAVMTSTHRYTLDEVPSVMLRALSRLFS